ncbi:hypothetical protein Tco_0382379 [Tanacetum coccineum]
MNKLHTDQNAEDERVTLANLIANLTLDTEENKKILKQLKKANASLTQELKESKSNLEESNTTQDSCLIALQSKQTELETIWKAFGGNTRDLGSFGEGTDKTTNLHQHLSRISTQRLETESKITRDAVTTHTKTTSQDLKTASDFTTYPII